MSQPERTGILTVQPSRSESTAATVEEGRSYKVPRGFLVERTAEQAWRVAGETNDVSVGLDGLLLESVRHQTGTDIFFRTPTDEAIRRLLDGLTYLRATRARPERSYEQRSLHGAFNQIGYGAERLVSLMRTMGTRQVRYGLPPLVPHRLEDVKGGIGEDWNITESSVGRCEFLAQPPLVWLTASTLGIQPSIPYSNPGQTGHPRKQGAEESDGNRVRCEPGIASYCGWAASRAR